MKKFRFITMILCIAAAAIICLFLNVAGGIGMTITDRADLGIPLLISSVFLITGTVIVCFKKVWLPIIFNIIGTVFYIYTVSQIYAIPNSSAQPKLKTEALAERHLLTVIVTILLFTLAVLNFFDEENTEKRNKKRRLKAENRQLSDDEKIV